MIPFLKSLLSSKGNLMKNLSPQDVHNMLKEGRITLIDVREPDEHKSESIQGAILCPLSTFYPHHLPECNGKPVVFHCAGGIRSGKVVSTCLNAGLPHDAHMAGGISAWKAAGLPTVKA